VGDLAALFHLAVDVQKRGLDLIVWNARRIELPRSRSEAPVSDLKAAA